MENQVPAAESHERLLRLQRTMHRVQNCCTWRSLLVLGMSLWHQRHTLRRLQRELGLYRGDRLEQFLWEKLRANVPKKKS